MRLTNDVRWRTKTNTRFLFAFHRLNISLVYNISSDVIFRFSRTCFDVICPFLFCTKSLSQIVVFWLNSLNFTLILADSLFYRIQDVADSHTEDFIQWRFEKSFQIAELRHFNKYAELQWPEERRERRRTRRCPPQDWRWTTSSLLILTLLFRVYEKVYSFTSVFPTSTIIL